MIYRKRDFVGEFEVSLGDAIRDGCHFAKIGTIANHPVRVEYAFRKEGVFLRRGVLMYADPDAELIIVSFQAAFGQMPLDVFADWLEARGPGPTHGEELFAVVLHGLREMSRHDRELHPGECQ